MPDGPGRRTCGGFCCLARAAGHGGSRRMELQKAAVGAAVKLRPGTGPCADHGGAGSSAGRGAQSHAAGYRAGIDGRQPWRLHAISAGVRACAPYNDNPVQGLFTSGKSCNEKPASSSASGSLCTGPPCETVQVILGSIPLYGLHFGQTHDLCPADCRHLPETLVSSGALYLPCEVMDFGSIAAALALCFLAVGDRWVCPAPCGTPGG